MPNKVWEDYLYPNGVLKNKLNIQDFTELQIKEYNRSNTRGYILRENPLKGELNFSLLKRIHRELFGDLYDWAGQIRHVEMRKSPDDPFFTSVSQIEIQANSLFYSLKRDNFFQNCRSKEEFINKSADFLNRLNTIHPFREGNGRAQKLFMNYVAGINQYRFNYKKTSKDDWNKAFEGSLHLGFYDRIAKVLNQIIEPINDLELVNLYRRSFNLNEIKEVKKEILTKEQPKNEEKDENNEVSDIEEGLEL